jgi:hypothetical protein
MPMLSPQVSPSKPLSESLLGARRHLTDDVHLSRGHQRFDGDT